MKAYFNRYKNAIVALSGGADSAAVLKLSFDFLGRQNVTALTCSNSHIFNYEIENARKVASVLGIKWLPFKTELPNQFIKNDEKRCFYCKESIMRFIDSYRIENKIDVIFDGSTIDDLKEIRPGFEALKKFKVKSPLLDNGKNKYFVNEICNFFEKKRIFFNNESCIATRIKEQNINKNLLARIEKIEDELRKDFKGIRVCFYPEYVRILFKESPELDINGKKYIESIVSKFETRLPVKFKEDN